MVLDESKRSRIDSPDARTKPLHRDRSNVIDEHKAPEREVRLGRIDRQIELSGRFRAREWASDDEPDSTAVLAVSRYDDRGPPSALLVTPNGVEIRPPDVAAPRPSHALDRLATDPTSHPQVVPAQASRPIRRTPSDTGATAPASTSRAGGRPRPRTVRPSNAGWPQRRHHSSVSSFLST